MGKGQALVLQTSSGSIVGQELVTLVHAQWLATIVRLLSVPTERSKWPGKLPQEELSATGMQQTGTPCVWLPIWCSAGANFISQREAL